MTGAGLGRGWAFRAALLAALWGLPARAGDTVLRTGDHAHFGRVVFVVPRGVAEQPSRQGDTLKLGLAGAGAVPGGVAAPRNVAAVTGGQDQATLQLAPGSHARVWHTGSANGVRRVVVDVYDAAGPLPTGRSGWLAASSAAPPEAPAARSAKPAPAPAPLQITLVPLTPPRPSQLPDVAQPALAPAPPPKPPVGVDVADTIPTDGLVAQRLPPDAEGGAPAILVPFERGVGAAAFAWDGRAHVVFADSKPVDLAALKDDPVFASARITLLQAATRLTMTLQAGRLLRLRRRDDGWVVAVVPSSDPSPAAAVALRNGIMTIGMPAAADTLVMVDAVTGGRLLVGVVAAPGTAVVVPHQSSEFTLLPSWAGVLVVAQSDRLALRAEKTGFVLANGSGPKLQAVLDEAAEPALALAGTLTRHFDFPPLPVPVLLARVRGALHAAAVSPRLGRLPARLRGAQAMLALGLDREADGLLTAALKDDAASTASPDAAALQAMAQFLISADDPPPTTLQAAHAALADPALGQSDEVTLWRAVTAPAASPQFAGDLSATWRLLLAYPAPLRHRLAPLVVERLLRGGHARDATALMDASLPDPRLNLLRAEALVQDHRVPDALALLDRIAGGVDRRQSAAASRQATELRLASHQLTPAEAAAALDQRLYAWRDEPTEIAQRLRVAALRTQAAQWRPALTLLRASDALFPAAHDQFHAAELAVIADLLQAGRAEKLPPLDLVALVGESADLLTTPDASVTLAPVLVDKLLALDLPHRADPLLVRLMTDTDDAAAKAGLGAKLAGLRLDDGNAAGAVAALDASDATGLPAALADGRAVLRARALVATGQTDAALAGLAAVDSRDALALRARLLEQRRDWHGAEVALLALLHATLPATGSLTDSQQDLLLRTASAASQAGDTATLQALQGGDARRLSTGPRQELFQALAQQPVRNLSDLPRSGREAVAARDVPAALASYERH